MIRLLLLKSFLLLSICGFAETIMVSNAEELKKASTNAKPGDVIILANGIWQNIKMELSCLGTKEKPISFIAETAGKVFISGNSDLKLGGSFIIIDGFYFTNGFAGNDAVIKFCIDKNKLANNCRVTNTVINDFNNPKRMDENYWVALYGKNNRVDHSTFLNKKNMGVLMAVILDDDRSRENFHSVDHNYFAQRLPLASNSGEIIRIGVSQHCEFNSNTQIVDNYFEHCDGETEIVSVKSCSNVVRNNVFKECQGSVVLRHGNYNTVENNIFLGNGKSGTGGVRIINKGQWVVNNLFYNCRGVGFRAPLSIMNGVVNSPPTRYVEVSDAVVMNNSFIDCTPISLCEGSDSERTVTPHHVNFEHNAFYNSTDKRIYNVYDDISGISFANNAVSKNIDQDLAKGFSRTPFLLVNYGLIKVPVAEAKAMINDSIAAISSKRLTTKLSEKPGFSDLQNFTEVTNNASNNCGAGWFKNIKATSAKQTVSIDCTDSKAMLAAIAGNIENSLHITLTGKTYNFSTPIQIAGNARISSANPVYFTSTASLPDLFEIKGGATLALESLSADLNELKAQSFISSDLEGPSEHMNFSISNSTFTNGKRTFFNAAKNALFDSIIVSNSSFINISGNVFNLNNETDKKGYYNVEQIKFNSNTFAGNGGQLLGMLRSGKDESTLGPLLIFADNKIKNCNADSALINLSGIQQTFITGNLFTNSNKESIVINFEDAVRAVHIFAGNEFISSGKVITDKFVEARHNTNQ